jgi:hypothetical protein
MSTTSAIKHPPSVLLLGVSSIFTACVSNNVKTGSSEVNIEDTGGEAEPEVEQTIACVSAEVDQSMCIEFVYTTEEQRGEIELYCEQGAGYENATPWFVRTTCPTEPIYAACLGTNVVTYSDGQVASFDNYWYEGICAVFEGSLEEWCASLSGTYDGPEGACITWTE